MTQKNPDILVFPRKFVEGYDRFVAWNEASSFMPGLDRSKAWLTRDKAESSRDWVQPIPCALIRNHSHRYCVLRRIRQTRADLRARISLIVGGHVERDSGDETVSALLTNTLRRELDEELGVRGVSVIKPVGLVVDAVSLLASRHVGFVYETVISRRLAAHAPEEFSSRSKFTGHFFSPAELFRFQSEFDPWSLILFEDYIAASIAVKTARQIKFPFLANE